MNSLIQRFSKIIASPLNYNEEQTAVIQYGLFAIVQIVLIGLLITLIGILADCVLECWIVYVAAGLLRKSTGGAHAKTANACLVVSVIAVSIIGMTSRYITFLPYALPVSIILSLFAFMLGCFIVFKLAPVGHPNKPLNKPEKIKRLRRQSLIILLIYAAFAILFLVLSHRFERSISLLVSLCLSVLWQAMTLVKSAGSSVGGCS